MPFPQLLNIWSIARHTTKSSWCTFTQTALSFFFFVSLRCSVLIPALSDVKQTSKGNHFPSVTELLEIQASLVHRSFLFYTHTLLCLNKSHPAAVLPPTHHVKPEVWVSTLISFLPSPTDGPTTKKRDTKLLPVYSNWRPYTCRVGRQTLLSAWRVVAVFSARLQMVFKINAGCFF